MMAQFMFISIRKWLSISRSLWMKSLGEIIFRAGLRAKNVTRRIIPVKVMAISPTIFSSTQSPVRMYGTAHMNNGQLNGLKKSILMSSKKRDDATKKYPFMLQERAMEKQGSPGEGNFRRQENIGSSHRKHWMRWMREEKYTGRQMEIRAEKSILMRARSGRTGYLGRFSGRAQSEYRNYWLSNRKKSRIACAYYCSLFQPGRLRT